MHRIPIQSTRTKSIAALLLTVSTVMSGVWLSHSGKPFNTHFFSIHKLAAVAAAIVLGILIFDLLRMFGSGTLFVLGAIIVSGFLERLLEAADGASQDGRVLEVLSLQALALQAREDLAHALLPVDAGLSLARLNGSAGHVKGETGLIASQLEQIPSKKSCSASDMLSPVGEALSGHSRSGGYPSLVEPLSEREIEVLEQLEQGLTNREIADELFITLNTVKVHTRNIYGKLGVRNRTQAVSEARTLSLLSAA